MEETIVSTRKVYSGRIVNLDVHEIRLSNGVHSMREQVRHPGAVAMVAFDNAQNVLLVRQYRLAAHQIMLEIPAGTLDPDEDPAVCAERELQEEAGYKPGKLTPLGGFFAAPGYTTEFIHLFLAEDLTESKLELDSDEFIEVVPMTLDNALKAVDAGEIIDGKTIVGLMRAARHLGR